MAISSINNQATSLEQAPKIYNIADMRKENDQKIIEAQLEVSFKDSPNALSLLFRAAIEEINKHIPTSADSNSVEKKFDNNLDVSTEATAKRIVSGATAFFNAYKQQNNDLSESEALTQFMGVIRSGIDIGFGQARDILNSLSVLEGEIASDIDVTYETVQTGLKDFNEIMLTTIKENSTQ